MTSYNNGAVEELGVEETHEVDIESNQRKKKKKSFRVNSNIDVELDFDLAVALGKLILGTKTDNSALIALGHQLRSLAEDDE